MTPETIGALGVALVAVIGAIGIQVANMQKAKADRAERLAVEERAEAERKRVADATYRENARVSEQAVQKAEEEAEARRDAYKSAFITTLQEERAKLIAEADSTRSKHGDCLALVGELTGRVESLEVQGNATEAKLADCLKAHELSARDARSLRERLAVVEKRAPSDPALQKVTP